METTLQGGRKRSAGVAWGKYFWITVALSLLLGVRVNVTRGDAIDRADTCSALEVAALAAADEYGHTDGDRWPDATDRIWDKYNAMSCDWDTYFLNIVPHRL